MGYWAFLHLGSSCCYLRKLSKTKGVDGSEGKVMETDGGAATATARALLPARRPGVHPSPNSGRGTGLRGRPSMPCYRFSSA